MKQQANILNFCCISRILDKFPMKKDIIYVRCVTRWISEFGLYGNKLTSCCDLSAGVTL